MKLKKVFSSVTAVAMAASIISAIPVYTGAATMDKPDGIETVLGTFNLGDGNSSVAQYGSCWVNLYGLDASSFSANNYVKFTISYQSAPSIGDGGDKMTTVAQWGWDAYSGWYKVAKFYDGNIKAEQELAPATNSQDNEFYCYLPASDFNAGECIEGNLMNYLASPMTIEAIELVEISQPVAPKLPENAYKFDTASGSADAYAQPAYTEVGDDKTVTAETLSGDFVIAAPYTSDTRPNAVFSDATGEGDLNWVQIKPNVVVGGVAYYLKSDILSAWTAAGGSSAFTDVKKICITATASALTVKDVTLYSTVAPKADEPEPDPEPVAENPTITALVDCGEGKVGLNWTAVEGAEKYAIYTVLNGKYSAVATATKCNAYINLTPGTKYGVLVRAYVNGAWTVYDADDIKYITPAVTAKPEITVLRDAGNGKVGVNWTAVDGATKYAVYTVLNGKYTCAATSTGLGAYVTKLTPGIKYGILVRAYVNGAWSKYTSADIKYITPKGSVAKPSITAVNTNTAGRVGINWTTVDGATKYAIYTYADGKYTCVGSRTTNGMFITNLTSGKKYGFLVRAYVNGAWTSYTSSDIAYATVK